MIFSSHFRTGVVLVLGLVIGVSLLVWRAQVQTAIRFLISVTPHPPHFVTEGVSVSDRVKEFGSVVRGRLEPDFKRAGVPYPPAGLALVALKQEKMLEVYAAGQDAKYRLIRSYPILAASGHAGPKLKEGDYQVPEGLYRIESLNPNSNFHLALRVNYPNEFDRANAIVEHREELGGDIMIHGSAVSIGCLAMGNEAAEDLFVIAALTGIKNIKVIMSPQDFRVKEALVPPANAPVWLGGLYQQIRNELGHYPSR